MSAYAERYKQLQVAAENLLAKFDIKYDAQQTIACPEFPESLKDLPLGDVFDLYDKFLRAAWAYRDAMSVLYTHKTTAQEATKQTEHSLAFTAKKDKSLKNADERKAWIRLQEEAVATRDIELLYRTAHDGLTHRVELINKLLRRIERELYRRTGYGGGDTQSQKTGSGPTQASAVPRRPQPGKSTPAAQTRGLVFECPACSQRDTYLTSANRFRFRKMAIDPTNNEEARCLNCGDGTAVLIS